MFCDDDGDNYFSLLMSKIGYDVKTIMLATFIYLECRYSATFMLIITMPTNLNNNFIKSAYELDISLLAVIEGEAVE